MRVAVIGAGIVGVMSAYELAADGHEVTVLERRSGIAAEASFGHAGLASPGYLVPWGGLSRQDAAHRPLWGRWLGQRSGQAQAQSTIRQRMQALGRYSQQRLLALEQSLQLSHEQQAGLLVLLRDKSTVAAIRAPLKMLAETGEAFHLVDADRAREIEPGLNPDMALQAAVHLPNDTVGNGRLFAQSIKSEAQRRGTRFLFDHEVQCITTGLGGEPQLQLRPTPDAPAPEPLPFDAVVVCAAADAGALLAPMGVRLPLTSLHGYSVTAPLQMQDHALDAGPRKALVDARHRVAISRLGDRVRVAGGAERDSSADKMNPSTLAMLYKVLEDWFPGAAQSARAQEWKGASVSLPDGMPLVGASGLPRVWLNLAHGPHGWALACGTARILADQLGGQAPDAGIDGLGIERLR